MNNLTLGERDPESSPEGAQFERIKLRQKQVDRGVANLFQGLEYVVW